VTYLLTPWSRVLEKLPGSQQVKKFPPLYGTRSFITAFTSVRHLSLSSALGRTKGSVQIRGTSWYFATWHLFTLAHLAQPPSWRTTPCRLSATAYSIYSQLPSILEAITRSATWGRAMQWWQEPTYQGFMGDWDNFRSSSWLCFQSYSRH